MAMQAVAQSAHSCAIDCCCSCSAYCCKLLLQRTAVHRAMQSCALLSQRRALLGLTNTSANMQFAVQEADRTLYCSVSRRSCGACLLLLLHVLVKHALILRMLCTVSAATRAVVQAIVNVHVAVNAVSTSASHTDVLRAAT
jgi:hypothetical protein